jgi:hypothetical protein
MRSSSAASNQRRGNRTKAVLPVRVKGTDSTGAVFEEIAHTLDVTPTGLRLGAMRRTLNLMDEVTVLYRQRKLQYRVVWIKQLKGTSEFQVGLQAIMHDGEAWGLGAPEEKVQTTPARAVSHASGVA